MGFFDTLFGTPLPQVRLTKRVGKFLEFGEWKNVGSFIGQFECSVRNIGGAAFPRDALYYRAYTKEGEKLPHAIEVMGMSTGGGNDPLKVGRSGVVILRTGRIPPLNREKIAYFVLDMYLPKIIRAVVDASNASDPFYDRWEEKWYARRGSITVGPVSSELIQALAAYGKLKAGDEVRQDGGDEWVEASGQRWLSPWLAFFEEAHEQDDVDNQNSVWEGKWHARRGKKTLGPYPPQQLKQMVGEGKLKPSDEMCRDGSAEWVVASKLDWLFPKEVAPEDKPVPRKLPVARPAAPLPPKDERSDDEGEADESPAPRKQ